MSSFFNPPLEEYTRGSELSKKISTNFNSGISNSEHYNQHLDVNKTDYESTSNSNSNTTNSKTRLSNNFSSGDQIPSKASLVQG